MITPLIALVLTGLWPPGVSSGAGIPTPAQLTSPARWASVYAQLPLSFEANQGQTDPRVKYVARGRGYTLWLTADQALLALHSGETRNSKLEAPARSARHSSLVTCPMPPTTARRPRTLYLG